MTTPPRPSWQIALAQEAEAPRPLSATHSTLADRIYEAALVPELWRGVLADIARLVAAEEAVILVTTGTRFHGWITTSPAFDRIVVEHSQRFPDNIRTRRLLALRHPGFAADRDAVSEAEMATDPLYRDFLIPRGYGAGIATAIEVPGGDAFIVHAERPFAAGPFGAEAVRALDPLRPHLARAALLSARLEMERVAATARALGMLGLPAAVLGHGGRLLAANPLLVGLMPDTLSDQPGRLAVVDPGADRLLRGALAAPAGGSTAPVRSIPIPAAEGRPPVILHLVPVRGAARDLFASARFILVATPVVARAGPDAEIVRGLFDLTPAEARLAALIAAGDAPGPAAAKLGIAAATARSVLKRVFQKTGVSRQAELVGLLTGLAGPGGT